MTQEHRSSIPYYNQNAELFYKRTINSDMSENYQRFLFRLGSPPRVILDLGCGVGRDARYFENLGYNVSAIDGAEAMVKYANAILKKPARLMLFREMNFANEFDGIWAAASLIHTPQEALEDVIDRIGRALRPNGIFFATFKHGKGEYTQEERTFYYMTEESMCEYLAKGFEVLEIWKTEDKTSSVAHSPDKTWLNILVRKKKEE